VAGPLILVGTAGWSYPDWENVIYSSAKSTDRLQTVAQYLDCVEVDSSFYSPPAPQTTANWVKATAAQPGFRFLAKAWQRFTHERTTPWTQVEHDLFTRGLAPLRDAGRLDALLFQFPWSFRNDTRNRDWLSRIAVAFANWPVAVELRHDSWLGDAADATLKFFRAYRLMFCNIDQPALAHCIPPAAHTTADTGYYRLHGRNARNWWFREKQDAYGGPSPRWPVSRLDGASRRAAARAQRVGAARVNHAGGRYDYLYSEAELAELELKIRQVAARAKKTFVVFNNHRDAKAFSNALQMKARLNADAKLRAPAPLVQRYPVLRACAIPDGDEQLPLA
jgi:uncharacterized protein YecE (DUF72 family)